MLFINFISLYLIVITIIAIFWTVQIRTLNGSNYSQVILLLCIAVCFYIFGYAMELNSYTKSQILFWNRVEYIGIPFVSALWLTIALMYIGCYSRHKKLLFAMIYIIPMITMLLRFTNDSHFLYFSSLKYIEKFGKLFLIKEFGIWMYVQLYHSMLMILVSMGVFIFDSINSKERQIGKICFTIGASFFAVSGLILSAIKPFDVPVDYMAMCLPITGIMIILAIIRYDLLEIKSIARNRAFEAGSDATLLINRQHKILDYNQCAKQLFEQLGAQLDDRYHLGTLLHNNTEFLEGLQSQETSVVKLITLEEEHYYEISTKNIDDYTNPRGWIKTIRDVTQINQLHEKLKKQAMTDVLSTLYNRRAFIQMGKELIEQSNTNDASLHLMMMDMDHFKNVNDQYGHPAGDEVIHNFGKMLKEHFPPECLIARLGGEEFAILYMGLSDEEILQTLNEFLNKIDQYHYCYNHQYFFVTISIGVTKKQQNQTLESMMRKADKALYQSKDKGRNCITVME